MFPAPLKSTKPGLFITATDTGVGKTVIACAIAWNLRRQMVQAPHVNAGLAPHSHAELRGNAPGAKVGVCKPIATGCRRDREGLVSEDAEALAHFADCRQALDIINPSRFVPPVAPAVAEELTGQAVDWPAIARSLELLDRVSDVVVVEGIGGLLAPIGRREDNAKRGEGEKGSGGDKDWNSFSPSPLLPLSHSLAGYTTVLDLATALGYPVVVVARAGLGTLNHTAMTVQLLRQAGCAIAGIVVNGFEVEPALATGAAGQNRKAVAAADLSMSTNRQWLERMNKVPILATVPACPPAEVAAHKARIPDAILEAVGMTYWPEIAAAPALAVVPSAGAIPGGRIP